MSGRPHRRMPGSLLIYLLGLLLIPMGASIAYAALLTHQGMQQSRVARQVEVGLHHMAEIDAVRSALAQEVASASVDAGAAAAGLTFDQLTSQSPLPISTPEQARAKTDAALASATHDAGDSPGLSSIVRQRATLIRQIDAAAQTGTPLPTRDVLAGYRRLDTAVVALELTAGDQVSAVGGYGRASTALAVAAAQATALTPLVVHADDRFAALYQAEVSTPGAARTVALRQLQAAEAVYDSAVTGSEPLLTGATAARWQTIVTSGDAKTFDEGIARTLAESRSASALSVAETIRIQRAAALVYQQENALLGETVNKAAAVAGHERDLALSRARTAVVVPTLLSALSLLLVFLVGAAVRRRLRWLAEGARRLSSGELAPVHVPGPRELQQAAQGLNDAVHSLGRALAGAERLAAGDLTAPALSVPAPGRLGEVVHAAFQQVTRAIEERERLQHDLAHAAAHDSLTGLPNRAAAEELLMSAVRDASDGGAPVSLLFIDLDHFKAVNDTHGHAAGDMVLQVVAQRMVSIADGDDTVCRLGGDEFVVVLRDRHDRARALGDRIVAAVREAIPWEGTELRVGASVGIAVSDSGDTTADDLLIRADRAVYRAKAEGRGLIRF